MKRYIYSMLFGLAIVPGMIFFGGCRDRKPIVVGFVGGLSGRVADLGVAGRNGVMLAVEQVNETGGIGGHKVDLVVRDDRQDELTAKTVIRELLAKDTEVIIGPMTSSMAVVMAPIVDASTAILVSPTVTTTDLTAKDDHFLRVIDTTKEYASKSARYQREINGRRSVCAIYDLNNKAYTENWLRDFRSTFEFMGGSIRQSTTFHSGNDAVFYRQTQALLSSQPDLFLIIANAVDAALICQQVRKMNKQVAIAISEWGATERFVELGGAATDGVFVSQFLDREDPSEKFRAFRSRYFKRFNHEPGFAGAAGYDAATIVLEALSARKPGQSLKQTILNKGRFECLQQVIHIDRFGDAERNIFTTIIQNGKFRKVAYD